MSPTHARAEIGGLTDEEGVAGSGALVAFLLDTLSVEELRGIVMSLEGGSWLDGLLPEGVMSRAAYCREFVRVLTRQERLDAEFFRALGRAIPARAAEVQVLADACLRQSESISARPGGGLGQSSAPCGQIAGYWWQCVVGQDGGEGERKPVRLSFLRILRKESGNTARIVGVAFDKRGDEVARFEGESTGINPAETRIDYLWTGKHPGAAPGVEFNGSGYFEFEDSEGPYRLGTGGFADFRADQKTKMTWKDVELCRADASQVSVMQGPDPQARAALVRAVQGDWRGLMCRAGSASPL